VMELYDDEIICETKDGTTGSNAAASDLVKGPLYCRIDYAADDFDTNKANAKWTTNSNWKDYCIDDKVQEVTSIDTRWHAASERAPGSIDPVQDVHVGWFKALKNGWYKFYAQTSEKLVFWFDSTTANQSGASNPPTFDATTKIIDLEN